MGGGTYLFRACRSEEVGMSGNKILRTLGPARLLAASLALYVVAPGGVELAPTGLEPAGGIELGAGGVRSAAVSGSFHVKGEAGPLFPRIPDDLVLTTRNPFDHPILVTAVGVDVGNASRRCRASNLRTPGFTSDVRVSALSNANVTIPIWLQADAPDACQGKIFPLRFSGRATRP
jgi:hypothetical protein